MTLIINPDDKNIWNKQYNVVLNRHAETMQVYANNASDALDEAIDYAEEQGFEGYFLSPEDIIELEADGFLDEYPIGGNHGRYVSSHNVSIVDVTGDDWS